MRAAVCVFVVGLALLAVAGLVTISGPEIAVTSVFEAAARELR